MRIIYDIETGPLAPEELALVEPKFRAPANYRRPEAIEEAIREAREAWVRDAALSPVTGRVLAIGYLFQDDEPAGDGWASVIDIDPDEPALLRRFWEYWCGKKFTPSCRHSPRSTWVGFNSNAFDLPFIVRRCWKLRVEVPPTVRNNRYWNPCFLDLMEVWELGDRRSAISLDQLAAHLGVTRKSGSGAMFAELLKSDREAAIRYLSTDLVVTRDVMLAIGGES